MANFICPFSKKVCNPSCEYWEFEKSKGNKLMGIIPVSFGMRDILGVINFPMPLQLIVREYQRYYDTYHPETSTLPKGRCLKLETYTKDLTEKEESDNLYS